MRFLLRARVAPWLVWSAILAVLATPFAGAAEHCAHPRVGGETSVLGHDHNPGHGGHHSDGEDSSDPAECPHCPPAQCGTQISCSAAGAELVATAQASGALELAPSIPSPTAIRTISSQIAPPTPPPQLPV
jgi:hypothetical protein